MERQNRVRKIGPISRELTFDTETGLLTNGERRISSYVVDLAIRVSRVVVGEPGTISGVTVNTYDNSPSSTTFQLASDTGEESSINLNGETQ